MLQTRVLLTATFNAPITSLYNTGVQSNSSNGVPLTLTQQGSQDSHFTLDAAPSGKVPAQSYVTYQNGYPFTGPSAAWVLTSGSQWISPHANENSLNGGAPNEPTGTFEYQTTFSLVGFDPSTVQIVGHIYTDNGLAGISVNGVATGIVGGSFGGSTFTLTKGFVAGTNTLQFYVVNDPPRHSNPSGLNVSFSGTANRIDHAPTDISLSNATISDQQPIGSTVGQFTTTDPDPGDAFSYKLGVGGDNSAFKIDPTGKLITAVAFDGSVKKSYTIQVTSTDLGGLSITKTFVISVTHGTIVDDSDPGFSATGHWLYSVSSGNILYYQKSLHDSYIRTSNDQAAWTFPGLAPGVYQVDASWVQNAGAASNVPFVIRDGVNGPILATVSVNERQWGRLDIVNGATFGRLATVTLTGHSLIVQVSNSGVDGIVLADAVRVSRVSGAATNAAVAPAIRQLSATSFTSFVSMTELFDSRDEW